MRLACALIFSIALLPPAVSAQELRSAPGLQSGGTGIVSEMTVNGRTLSGFIKGAGGKTTITPDAVQVPGSTSADGLTSLSDAYPPAWVGTNSTTPVSAWRSRHFNVRSTPGPHTDYGYIGELLNLDVAGSGINGPTKADHGKYISMIKRGFYGGARAYGEMNAFSALMRQAGPAATSDENSSDMDGIQMNIGTLGDPGYSAGAEFQNIRLSDDGNYSLTHQLSLQLGINSPWGKNSELGLPKFGSINRLTAGYVAIAEAGALDRAFYALPGSGTWEDYAYFGPGSSPQFRVKGADGSIVLGPDTGSVRLAKDNSNRLTVQSTGGPALPVQTVPSAWTDYTPSAASASGSITTATASGRYQVIGKRLDVRVQVSITTAGTGAGLLRVGLPAGMATTAGPYCVGSGRENAVNGKMLQAFISSGDNIINITAYDQSSVIADGAQIHATLTCEIQ